MAATSTTTLANIARRFTSLSESEKPRGESDPCGTTRKVQRRAGGRRLSEGCRQLYPGKTAAEGVRSRSQSVFAHQLPPQSSHYVTLTYDATNYCGAGDSRGKSGAPFVTLQPLGSSSDTRSIRCSCTLPGPPSCSQTDCALPGRNGARSTVWMASFRARVASVSSSAAADSGSRASFHGAWRSTYSFARDTL